MKKEAQSEVEHMRTSSIDDSHETPAPGDQRPYRGLRHLQDFEQWLQDKANIETQGIKRVAEDERRPPSTWNIFLLWASFNVHAPSLTLGILGAELGLSLRTSVAACMIGIVVGAFLPAFNGTLGPKLLSAVSDFSMSITVGIIIVSILDYIISFFGYRVLHTFEKYSWIVAFILLSVLLGQAAPHANTEAKSLSTGLPLIGSFLTLLAVNMSNSAGWCTAAADFLVHYPSTLSRWLVATLIYSGIVVFTTFPVVVGVVVGNVGLFSGEESPYFAAFEEHGAGGLIARIYHPIAWSKFALVFLSWSALGNGVCICYSAGLSLQTLGPVFQAVPRSIWSLLFIIVVAVISIAGQEHLSSIVLSFVSVVGYWSVAFFAILFLEDQVVRKKTGYDLDAWNQPEKLPWGMAAILALLAGYLAGGLPGMAQTWYVGPIAAKFGPYGGDVGMWLCVTIAALVYLPLRLLERHLIGR
ncbi:Purine-cytosine permease fcyB [Pseudocercospora fuligena]|uniref:Purine-cytosine permease fcyB n=1 Tax=Pseudocercospora fuligena TaxID=685502 RepID=A0A8H6VPE4_9PEZI|nr:Purine-cytosine permease fcyB [Pseudocercospora fuligena]